MDQDIKHLGLSLKEAYRELRANVDPGFSYMGKNEDPQIWDKTAKIVKHLGADPVEFIKIQFLKYT